MKTLKIDSKSENNTPETLAEVARFLHQALEQYGDQLAHIQACLEYAVSETAGKGGFIVTAREGKKLYGAVVINHTGMKGYIPENILVYIAVDPSARGKGVGMALMEEAIRASNGDIALHVEPDNPARRLYERLGFTSKYLEMRLHKPT